MLNQNLELPGGLRFGSIAYLFVSKGDSEQSPEC